MISPLPINSHSACCENHFSRNAWKYQPSARAPPRETAAGIVVPRAPVPHAESITTMGQAIASVMSQSIEAVAHSMMSSQQQSMQCILQMQAANLQHLAARSSTEQQANMAISQLVPHLIAVLQDTTSCTLLLFTMRLPASLTHNS